MTTETTPKPKARKKSAKSTTQPGALPPTRTETWLNDDVRLLTRVNRLLKSREIAVMLGCERCEQLIAWAEPEADGALRLVCGCAVRRLAR